MIENEEPQVANLMPAICMTSRSTLMLDELMGEGKRLYSNPGRDNVMFTIAADTAGVHDPSGLASRCSSWVIS